MSPTLLRVLATMLALAWGLLFGEPRAELSSADRSAVVASGADLGVARTTRRRTADARPVPLVDGDGPDDAALPAIEPLRVGEARQLPYRHLQPGIEAPARPVRLAGLGPRGPPRSNAS